MRPLAPARGFTMLNLLITVAIIGVLAVLALQDYKGALRTFQPGGGSTAVNSPGFSTATIITQLRQLHTLQLDYHQRFNRYATFEELREDGGIPRGYNAKETDPNGIAFIQFYDLAFRADAESFIILAFPNAAAAVKFKDTTLPAYRVDQTGNVTEEEGWDEGLDDDPMIESDPADLDRGSFGEELPPEEPAGESLE